MLGMMATGVRPAWTIHRQQGSQIPPDNEAARRYLRRGNLAEALLPGGPGPALVAGDLAVSHDELRAAAGQAASRLEQAGVTQGTHVAMFAENSGAWIISYLGLQLLGATVVGMNPAFKAAEAEQILTDSEAAVVLVDAGRQALIDTLRPRLRALRISARIEEIGSVVPGAPSPASGSALNPESPALLLYTSGTTGRPKGALLDHGNLLAQARGVVAASRSRSTVPWLPAAAPSSCHSARRTLSASCARAGRCFSACLPCISACAITSTRIRLICGTFGSSWPDPLRCPRACLRGVSGSSDSRSWSATASPKAASWSPTRTMGRASRAAWVFPCRASKCAWAIRTKSS